MSKSILIVLVFAALFGVHAAFAQEAPPGVAITVPVSEDGSADLSEVEMTPEMRLALVIGMSTAATWSLLDVVKRFAKDRGLAKVDDQGRPTSKYYFTGVQVSKIVIAALSTLVAGTALNGQVPALIDLAVIFGSTLGSSKFVNSAVDYVDQQKNAKRSDALALDALRKAGKLNSVMETLQAR